MKVKSVQFREYVTLPNSSARTSSVVAHDGIRIDLVPDAGVFITVIPKDTKKPTRTVFYSNGLGFQAELEEPMARGK